MPVELQEVSDVPIYGNDSNNVIYETAYSFEYYGLGGNDVFYAALNDWVSTGYGYYYPDDYFYGGSGSDTISYVLSGKKIIAHLGLGSVHRIHDGEVQSTDYLDSIENLTGTSYGDQITGSGADNILRGGGGSDNIDGAEGDDDVYGDSGNDTLDGGEGHDMVDGGTGADVVHGNDGHDSLYGRDGNDSLFGDDGHDRLEGGGGNDAIDGGEGIDTVVYTGSGDVTVDLWHGTASGAWGNDTLTDIEWVETGGGDDVVWGSFGSNRLSTGDGDDVVLALDGDDTVYAGTGADTVYGYEGEDFISGGSGNDVLWAGSDADTVYGEGGADKLKGEDGDDFLHGGDGADRLRGGDGLDTLVGGSHADVFEWLAGDNGFDVVSDFNMMEDRLWFGAGFFATEPVGAVDLGDVLIAVDAGPHALLVANTADQGWVNIAMLLNVDTNVLHQMIESESILPAPVVELGGVQQHDLMGTDLNDDPFAMGGGSRLLMANYDYGML
jgi:Ca2+-binding RTX toxin-like protein